MNYLRYTAIFLGVAVASALIVLALNTWADAGLGASGQLLAPAMIAALLEGRAFVRDEGRVPNPSEAWNFALLATGLAVLLNAALSFGAVWVIPEGSAQSVAPIGTRAFWLMLAVHAIIYLLSNRFFLGLGARNEEARRNRPGAS
ncbi:ABZJ_00895 family protein [Roseovarius aquimarinus]|uniref:ABZJ_00895 family protein n=1 Tax=Roseovarius aquimarinus TaxID=1229156 RepID=A0ABW7I7E3_9RHOB